MGSLRLGRLLLLEGGVHAVDGTRSGSGSDCGRGVLALSSREGLLERILQVVFIESVRVVSCHIQLLARGSRRRVDRNQNVQVCCDDESDKGGDSDESEEGEVLAGPARQAADKEGRSVGCAKRGPPRGV
ncbi:hypothetical protein DFJ73DRAFT_811828 [Zopfochytrium polystomum]|nr:hypothetical protein DFJ73DRAFT_811828 [Zopfochytrium polystomum]